jgi:hypothetical protein
VAINEAVEHAETCMYSTEKAGALSFRVIDRACIGDATKKRRGLLA